jgi:hypothetical protein
MRGVRSVASCCCCLVGSSSSAMTVVAEVVVNGRCDGGDAIRQDVSLRMRRAMLSRSKRLKRRQEKCV